MLNPGPKNPVLCRDGRVAIRAKDDLLHEGRQSLNYIFADCFGAVSYTHLTLPTIYSV